MYGTHMRCTTFQTPDAKDYMRARIRVYLMRIDDLFCRVLFLVSADFTCVSYQVPETTTNRSRIHNVKYSNSNK